MYGKWNCILPITWTYGEKTEVSYTSHSSRIEVELKNAIKKYWPEELLNLEKQITSKSNFRDDNLMAKENSST
jgi:hypothetical protein